MANEYVNKVVKSTGETIIDITDTTAAAEDVAAGKYFYAASGTRTAGTAAEKAYHIAYDELSSVGIAETGTAVTGTPNYIPSGDIEYTASEVDIVTNVSLTGTWSNNVLTISFEAPKVHKSIVEDIGGLKGDGVTFVIKEDTE